MGGDVELGSVLFLSIAAGALIALAQYAGFATDIDR